ncbi:MAG: single-stranded-DNA-specific exonuclease RecJ [Dokdonia sp.]|jgi:single-stranded-DNA-specific exonuclease
MRWTLQPKPLPAQVEALRKQLGVPTAIAALLVQRDIDSFEKAKHFFRPSLDNLHDPFLMKDMQAAVERIQHAIAHKERILVYGDYDVDGTTSVALMSAYLKTIHPDVATYIPDRYEEGYGVSYAGIDYAHDNDMTLIIALDCGVKAIDKVAYAKTKGIDFIICDHHRPGLQLPDAIAVLDPKRDDCNYPFDELCGCGVGFKLITALSRKRNQSFDSLIPYLDLVATAIGADIVPIVGENRILAYHGLEVIQTMPRAGIQAILDVTSRDVNSITDVVFTVAPRINAAGRMKHGNHAVSLLTETNLELARQYAAEIEQYNTDRRATDKQITEEALAQITSNNEQDRSTTVVYKEDWHKGVIGIVASRLTETYYRPTLVFTRSGDKLAASARSVRGFDVYNALEGCAEFINQFGGHKYAAGLTLLPENYEAFKEKFEQVVTAQCDRSLLTPELKIDAVITLADITPKFYRIIKQFAPFGPGNMAPVFMSEMLQDVGQAKKVGTDLSHLKLKIKQANLPKAIDGIGFGLGHAYELVQKQQVFKAAYALDENKWRDKVSLQLRVKDIKPQLS